jgi:hypothetical protein
MAIPKTQRRRTARMMRAGRMNRDMFIFYGIPW